MASAMHAVVIENPGGPEVLEVRELPRPIPRPGEVLVRVEAFGVNRSEQHFRRGLGSFGSFPRVPGLEAVGTVAAAPGGEFSPGQQVAALMGGMGRLFDGGTASPPPLITYRGLEEARFAHEDMDHSRPGKKVVRVLHENGAES